MEVLVSKSLYVGKKGFTVLSVKPLGEKLMGSDGILESFICVGNNLPNVPLTSMKIKGQWIKNKKFGLQFQIESFIEREKKFLGIIAYLNNFKSITFKEAIDIYSAFGMESLRILNTKPEKLLEIYKNKETFNSICVENEANRKYQEIFMLLSPLGVKVFDIINLYETIKETGISVSELIIKEPYRWGQLDLLSFNECEKLAKEKGNNGVFLSYERMELIIKIILDKSITKGNTYIKKELLMKECVETLEKTYEFLHYSNFFRIMIKRMEESKIIKIENDRVYRYDLFLHEKEVARDLKRLDLYKKFIIDETCIKEEMNNIMESTGVILGREQKEAVVNALVNQVSIITGGPGTGKTTIVKCICDIFIKKFDGKITLISPTGRAAKALSTALEIHIRAGKQSQGRTIHNILSAIPTKNGYLRYDEEDINADFVIVDEISMLDIQLFSMLLRALKNGTKLLLIGDVHQLQAIGPGEVLTQMLEAETISTTSLTKVFRQSSESNIFTNSALIKNGISTLNYGDDFMFLEEDNFSDTARTIVKIYLEALKEYDEDEIMILTPYRAKTPTGTNALNKRIRNIVNPNDIAKKEVFIDGKTFREGDRIVFLENNNKVSNGDVGKIKGIKHGTLSLEINSKIVYFNKADPALKKMSLAYAVTVHKSQGSEYAFVLFTVQEGHKNLTRNLCYTAITRAKEKCIIIGQKSALSKAIMLKERSGVNCSLGQRMKEMEDL
ncbi:MAG: SF1B family DNA helicase RecD2 [Eubacteriaceae bacterium]